MDHSTFAEPGRIIEFAVHLELYIFAIAFAVCVLILSLGAAYFMIKMVWQHAFPTIKQDLPIQHGPAGFQLTPEKEPTP